MSRTESFWWLKSTVVECFLGLCWVLIYRKVNYFNDLFVFHILIKTLTQIWELLEAVTSELTWPSVCLVDGSSIFPVHDLLESVNKTQILFQTIFLYAEDNKPKQSIFYWPMCSFSWLYWLTCFFFFLILYPFVLLVLFVLYTQKQNYLTSNRISTYSKSIRSHIFTYWLNLWV